MIRASALLAILAVAVSAAVHVGGIAVLGAPDQTPEVAGSVGTPAPRLGNSFREIAGSELTPVAVDQKQEAAPPDSLVTPETPDHSLPVTTELQALSPPVTQKLRPPVQNTGAVVEPLAVTEPVATKVQVTKVNTVAAPTNTVKPLQAQPLKPTLQTLSASKITPLNPTSTVSETTPTLAALPDETAPVLSNRPRLRPKSVEAQAAALAPKSAATRPKPSSARQPTRQAAQTRGQTEGQKTGSQSQASQTTGTSKRAGNAAASNYPGIVFRKISRSRVRSNTRGKTVVTFRIAANGALAGLSIVQSSGSQTFDTAALQAVRRAAPFPRPPAGARRSFNMTIKR